MDGAVFTVADFCKSEKISRAHYYNLKARGEGPREMRLGKCVRISPEARAAWRREREVA
jgi:predicted DNA-binding transcriptional regulator AlpA